MNNDNLVQKIARGAVVALAAGAFIGSGVILYKACFGGQDTDKTGPKGRNRSDSTTGGGTQKSVQIFRICLSGGLQSGKRTAAEKLNEYLTSLGMKVFVVPDCSVVSETAGIDPLKWQGPKEDQLRALIAFMKMLKSMEDYFLSIARDEIDKDAVVISLLGAAEIQSRVSAELWEAMLAETGWTTSTLREKRYDAVLHLVTAADGAQEHFEGKGISAEEARQLDRKVTECWTGHPEYLIIRNLPNQDFEQKINSCVAAVGKLVGQPTPIKYCQKFLIEVQQGEKIEFPEELKIAEHHLTEVFLRSTRVDSQVRMSRQTAGGVSRFIYSCRTPTADGKQTEVQRQITAQDYLEYMPYILPETAPVEKNVYSFTMQDVVYQLEEVVSLQPAVYILRVHGDQSLQQSQLPSFLKAKEDITRSQEFVTLQFSRRVAKRESTSN